MRNTTPHVRRWLHRGALGGILVALSTVWACQEATNPPIAGGDARLQLQASVAGTSARTLLVSVTARDLPAAIMFQIDAVDGVVTSPLTIPSGPARTISIRALNPEGLVTHSGSLTVDLVEGANVTSTVILSPEGGGPTIHATLGVYVVTVNPEVSELRVGDTVRLAATVTDIDGNPKRGEVDWLASRRDIVSVDSRGLVTALAPGVATIAAEFRETVGLARVFVAGARPELFVNGATGDDANPGTRSEPFATIQHAIETAHSGGAGGDVFVAAGSYVQSLTLRPKVSLYGGYDGESWLRDVETFPVNVFGGSTAVTGTGVDSLTIDGLAIWSADATSSSGSSVGVSLIDSRKVLIAHNTIKAGLGGDGLFGANGSSGGNGSPGEPGKDGDFATPSAVDQPCGGRGGLGGGTAPAGGRGGSGIIGSLLNFLNLCAVSSTDGAAGGNPRGGPGGVGATFFLGDDGQSGTAGAAGATGAHGPGGTAFGTFAGGAYVPADGADGGAGENGGGGGGGGGGDVSSTNSGGGGGGGGGGASGGGAGLGARGGGGSFGITIARSSEIEIRANQVKTDRSGRGGNGGAGGTPGAGGPGGNGGNGGPIVTIDVLGSGGTVSFEGGYGGDGGPGGSGGEGGAGGGGGGGPSIGIMEDRASTTTRSGNLFEVGVAGTGGAGPNSNPGVDGVRAEFAKLAGTSSVVRFLQLVSPKD